VKGHFSKYHGLGNDYLVIDPKLVDVKLTPDAIRLICHRNFGVGSDGILYGPLGPSTVLRAGSKNLPQVRIFNPDGSEAEKSGNGLRIFAKYLFENKYVRTKKFKIKTLGGIVDVNILDDTANNIRINMGKVTFVSTEIPVAGNKREVVNETLVVNKVKYSVTCASIGNPHCIIPMAEVSEEKARQLGPFVENHKMFPKRINVQLLKVLDRNNIEIRIWERGAGYTLASGSSSCAAAATAYKLGLVGNKVNVKMPGGTLLVEIDKDWEIFMTGAVEGVFTGCFHADIEKRLSNKRCGF